MRGIGEEAKMNKSLPLEQRIKNAFASQECERLHGIHQYLIGTERVREEYATIWDMSDDAAWGFNWGQLRGFREIWDANCNAMFGGGIALTLDNHRVFPEVCCMETNSLYFWEYNELNSGVIEVADDGKSCRAAWMCHGMGLTRFNADDGKVWGANTFERYGSDFILDEQDGRWKYLHEQVCNDFMLPMDDGNWGNEAYDFASRKVPEPGQSGWDREIPFNKLNFTEVVCRAGEDDTDADDITTGKNIADGNNFDYLGGPVRTGRKTWHWSYGALQPIQRTTPPPEPYSTLDEKNSYVPLHVKPIEDLWTQDERGLYIVNPKYQ